MISDMYDTSLINASRTSRPHPDRLGLHAAAGAPWDIPLKFSFHNPSSDKITGSYDLVYANQRARVSFELAPLQTKEFSNQCSLPKDDSRWGAKNSVVLTVDAGNAKFIEEREVEVIRNQRLGEARPLARAADLRCRRRAA